MCEMGEGRGVGGFGGRGEEDKHKLDSTQSKRGGGDEGGRL